MLLINYLDVRFGYLLVIVAELGPHVVSAQLCTFRWVESSLRDYSYFGSLAVYDLGHQLTIPVKC